MPIGKTLNKFMGNVLFLFICICFFACTEQVKETHIYISSVYLFVLNALEFSMSAKDVVNKPRFHHQLLPKDVIRYHNGFDPAVITEFKKMGYTMSNRRFGDMHVILNKDGKIDAASEANRRRKSIVF
jgi:gamma-glutamyltranspeptidase/glutathione hydrolase